MSPFNTEGDYHIYFLMTYRTFCSPLLLIEKLDEIVEKKNEKAIIGRITLLIFCWLKMRKPVFDEFNDYVLIQKMTDLVNKLPKAKELKQLLTQDISPYPQPPPVPPNSNEFFSQISEIKVETIVEQLCLVDHYLLSSISPPEFENQNWNKTNEENNFAPNLSRISQRFNYLSSWITYYIISSDKEKERTHRFIKFVSVLEKLMQNNNFFCSRSVYAALKSVPISVKKKILFYFILLLFLYLTKKK